MLNKVKNIVISGMLKITMFSICMFITIALKASDIVSGKPRIDAEQDENIIPVIPEAYISGDSFIYYKYRYDIYEPPLLKIEEYYNQGYLTERLELLPDGDGFSNYRQYSANYDVLNNINEETLFLYDNINFIWRAIETKLYTYDGKNTKLEIYKKAVSGYDTLFTTYVTYYTYDIYDTLRQSLTQARDTVSLIWGNLERITYEYVNSLNKTIKIVEYWDTLAKKWVNSVKTEEINENNHLMEKTVYEWVESLSKWVETIRDSYVYDGDEILEKGSSVYDYIEKNWVNGSKETYLYDIEGIQSIQHLFWDSFQKKYINAKNIIYEYTFDGVLVVTCMERIQGTTGLQTQKVFSTFYEGFTPVGVFGKNKSDILYLFPNPTNDILKINKINSVEISGIYIFNMSGILKKSINEDVNEIMVNDLEAGLYFIKIIFQNGGHVMKKIIVE